MIQGYPDDASAFPGDTITFHVATDAPQFRIEFFRQGATLADTGVKTDWLAGSPGEDHEGDQDFGTVATRRDGKQVTGWQGYPFLIPDWQPGVYIAMLIEGDGNGQPSLNQQPPIDKSTPDARSGKALFVVKNATPGFASQVLYKIPLFTYQMYNMTRYTGIDGQVYAGAGYPFFNSDTGRPMGGLWVTFHRPGGGTGGTPWDAVYFGAIGNQDPLDPQSFRQTFVHWDAKMIAWLEWNGFRVDYCTDVDIHNDVNLSLLSPYALLLSVGHDEYYSTQMRDNLDAFIANGGNIAFFSGNTSYWRLIFPVTDGNGQPDLRFITRNNLWFDAGRPEDALTGVGFRHGGERNYPVPNDDNTKVGYTVQNTVQWPFENSGLNDNDTFGKDLCIVGYECDGAPYDQNAPWPVSPTFTGVDGTPANLIILGTGVTSVWPQTKGSATMAMYNNVGTVFTGASTDWPRVLSSADAPTMAITRNVVNRLGGNPKGLAELGNVANLIACDGFFSADDNFRHAVIATGDGNIREFPYSPIAGQPQGISAFLNGVIDIGGFTSDDDRFRHIVAVDVQNNVWDIAWDNNNQPIVQILVNIPNAIRVAGFYTADDQIRHAIVGTTDGNVIEVYYAGIANANPRTASLGSFANLVDVGGFFSPDDGYRHAMVGTADGTITEIFYRPNFGIFQTPVATVPDLVRVSGYYADGDSFFNRRVQALTNGGRVHEVRYSPAFGVMRAVLFNPGALVDLGGFYTNDDNFRHSIFATPRGDVQELFYVP
ncbi:N,N-dimethylformamidase beta subunit family domain-containing protein [Burkholderia ubonensis]|uniref:N,N-dimethylformamidase beta subunit family domain-containing protein n=1 Tax=Burkholderia ubonensis TaxID=101571 RepID=UPI00075C6CB9|nr:N,N-dimethylformamidase beta subunit family domain-containing protein [Burkholderia ubonensis]KWK76864.1 hypothetical protein WM15_28405 [Burkholderia ubonensis]